MPGGARPNGNAVKTVVSTEYAVERGGCISLEATVSRIESTNLKLSCPYSGNALPPLAAVSNYVA